MTSGFRGIRAALGLLCICLQLSGCAQRLVVESKPGQFLPPSKSPDKVRYCDAWYPPSEAASGEGRVTAMSARITVAGDLRDVVVTRSSGKADLDAAAATCAAHTYIRPAVKGGSPIEMVWAFEVQWHPQDHSFVTIRRPEGYPLTCSDYYPAIAARNHEYGYAIVNFVVGPDGSVNRPMITRSSGYGDLDQAALACVTSWRYLPATVDSKPIEFGWRALVNWRPVQ